MSQQPKRTLRPDEVERNVARAAIGVALGVAVTVGAAMVSNGHHAHTNTGDATIAAAMSRAVPSTSPTAWHSTAPSRPMLVAEASGDPLLRTGFGHLHLVAPATYGNLAVYPVYADGAAPKNTVQFATLGESMGNGTIEAGEPGFDSASKNDLTHPAVSVTNAEEGSEHRGANLLMVANSGPNPTYIPDGEVVPGGDQDRGVATDTIVPARSASVAVAAFCVEHGRSFGSSPLFQKEVAMAQPSVRYAMQVVGEQQPVWDAVGVADARFNLHPETGTYRALMQSTDANAAAARYAEALTMPVQTAAHGKASGVVVAINGKIVCADIYRDPALFQKLWPSLLRSYATQAAVSGTDRTVSPTRTEAAAWLTTLDRAPGAQTRHADLTQVARVATPSGAGIRTAAIADASGLHRSLLHEVFFTPAAVLTD